MPAKNTVKTYIEDGYYHVYNRGVEKRDIFLDDRDYRMFLYQIKYYLGIPEKDDIKQNFRSLRNKVYLLAYCLMPNHYHLLVKQISKDGMTKLLRAVCTNYVTYFNTRYKRVGGLFQGKYKAAMVDKDEYFLHLSRYIHINPRELNRVGPYWGSDPLRSYPYSSYNYYIQSTPPDWLNINELLAYFPLAQQHKNHSYQEFVENRDEDSISFLDELILEEPEDYES